MASFEAIGFIDNIKYLNQGGCFVFLSEFKKGYRKANGEIVADKYMSWKCIFKAGLVNYINNHFSNGMLVQVKGEIFPYAMENGNFVDGYSVIGQTINIYSYPRNGMKAEQKMMKESQMNSDGVPDIDSYNQPDF